MQSIPTIPSEVERELRSFGVRAGQTVLAAYSTGPDSTALLSALCSLRGQLGIKVVAAYFDHGLRRRRVIELDIAHARTATHTLRVPLRIGSADCSASTIDLGGPEAAARAARYRFLESLADECAADWIAVGHTADDRAETVLMRALQGVGVAGLGGMPAQRGRIVRPLNALRRGDLRAWLSKEGMPFRRDRHNIDQRFMRNRVRRLIRMIEGRFPGATNRLVAVGRQAESTQRFVSGLAASELEWRQVPLGVSVPWLPFQRAHPTMQREAIYQGYDLLLSGTGHRRLPLRFVSALLRMVANGNRRVHIKGHGVIVERARNDLIMSREVVPGYRTGYLWRAVRSGTYRVPETDVEIRRVGHVQSESRVTPVTVVQLYNVDGPLLIRSRQSGDDILLQSGVTPLRVLLHEWGTPASQRWKIPVVADNRGVLAICGAVFGYQDVVSTWCADVDGNSASAVIEINRIKEES